MNSYSYERSIDNLTYSLRLNKFRDINSFKRYHEDTILENLLLFRNQFNSTIHLYTHNKRNQRLHTKWLLFECRCYDTKLMGEQKKTNSMELNEKDDMIIN